MNVALPVSTYAGSDGYLRQLLSGLFWLHSKNVTHNDVKTANILLDPTAGGKGRAILVDFGFASVHDPIKGFSSRQNWGTPEYLAVRVSSRVDCHKAELLHLIAGESQG